MSDTNKDTGADEAVTDEAATDKAATDKAATDKAATDKAATDKAATDKAATDKAATDKAATDKPASGKPAGLSAGEDKAKLAKDEPPHEDSFRSNLRTIAGAFLVAIFIRVVVFEAFEIEGPSMEPTFVNGDRVIVAKYPFGLFLPFMNDAVASWGMPQPGDVVIVRSPADNVDIVKRVIGVPGDRVEIRDDVVYRNGEAIRTREIGPCREDESSEDPGICVWYEERIGERVYRTSTSLIEPTESLSEREVPPGHVFVLGDHRDRSNDSRNPAVGMIPIGRVKGRADAIYWSSDEEIRWDRIFSLVR